jgi:non-heme chloroperoxidase
MELLNKWVAGGGGCRLFSRATAPREGVPCLLIPGIGVTWSWWRRQLESDMAGVGTLVAYDLRGQGSSDKPLEPQAYQESRLWAEDIQAVIGAWGLDRPVLVGWSYGGHAALDYIRHFGQDGVRGLVLVDANVELGTEMATASVAQDAWALFPKILSPQAGDYREGLEYGLTLLSAQIAPEDEATFLGGLASVPPFVWQAMFDRKTDNADLLRSIRLPTLIVHGSKDRIIALASSECIALLITRARAVTFASGHAPFYEEWRAFNHALATFVEESTLSFPSATHSEPPYRSRSSF